ncbi:lytic transglycosylase domain-containing protein (plasmid) [Rhizobium indicum]|uniref:Lytic transglycosylase domain-containing protein n=1 Tax=Rhizobium indicum TaxID=2583231 RepID=A0ABX6PRI2_9HYPH|nr:lytic transglycosylase domain-containing protein [Rhizobium leguminosarum]QKK21251.1 lytic transglycosylase domain-containing protein [Rhizobium indicum]NKL24148.1 transglycosylase SLT domain-containing protein [Rhizobium leguminosarum bv. viciae]NKL38884.1 transglycosylase SLT domain-containing protein [Rhizobium leguminosarum bv. viciae]NKL57769.1 transglycosylase SLT domain-containing protein [Rhizobium leguminosarum bv. viciae]QKK34664.1 lytic transglycosylase domain-containing protein 
MSAFLLTGFASDPCDSDLPFNSGTPAHAVGPGGITTEKARRVAANLIPIAVSLAVAAKQPPQPTIDWVNFSQRFDAPKDEDPIGPGVLSLDTVEEFENSRAELPGEAADSANARRERTVHSPIDVFSFKPTPFPHIIDTPVALKADDDLASIRARPDLLSGIPEEYAKLALAIAAAEDVDPNWVLSIMRAENANFDPRLVSPAGAVGLMQVMPGIGAAFGANDLADPEQNIRAGTRFLRVLIDKYRNPVLVASAYNAGEPRVDLRHSLPLIRETADYVTRVVGFYVGPAATSTGTPSLSSASESGLKSRAGTAGRAKSPMLVFSVADPLTAANRSPKEDGPTHVGGPIKIVKEEVH